MPSTPLPPLAPFPEPEWRQHLNSSELESLIEAWHVVSSAYLSLPDDVFAAGSSSVAVFVSSFVREVAASSEMLALTTSLLRPVFQLCERLVSLSCSSFLADWVFLSSLAGIYPKKRTATLISRLFASHTAAIESSLGSLKKSLLPHLTAGTKGDLKLVESRLSGINPLLHASPQASAFLLAGSDFFDGLVVCFRVMNPPLRKVIVATTYLCLIGLTEGEPPRWAMLGDQLFALKSAADAHKQGILNVDDSLVAELVTVTPLLQTLLRRVDGAGASEQLLTNRIKALEPFRKGPMIRPRRKTRVDKGKGRATQAEMQFDQMSKITQIQDLFPDLGAGFISRCLDEYGQDAEQVVASLLGESLPIHLASADRSEPLRNVFDDDEFDRLAADTSKISFGKKTNKTADDLLADKSTAPSKAAIFSALAAFDSDDDERDDTYDAADVGGTVDATNQEADDDGNEELLFKAYTTDDKAFARDAATRRSAARSKLRQETGMTDEAIEGWATMLARDPQRMKRLEARYISMWTGVWILVDLWLQC
ncbi:hypothetical protein CDD80_4030 [Ophiocordyceps camponoti-rufipedis]|uniref:CUE domain-containing protein n=1 Tax=Ophiocordyceps camponoti-rufipedis TaxID=2004952 RepID=A0A2C5Z1P7_9HYPO|nr:hypothetical protein CDD80_4030 [Ophiocordyceps camponoti-rufipedis]